DLDAVERPDRDDVDGAERVAARRHAEREREVRRVGADERLRRHRAHARRPSHDDLDVVDLDGDVEVRVDHDHELRRPGAGREGEDRQREERHRGAHAHSKLTMPGPSVPWNGPSVVATPIATPITTASTTAPPI